MADPRPYDERPKYVPRPRPAEKHPITVKYPPVDDATKRPANR
jgi:hypothetical protein